MSAVEDYNAGKWPSASEPRYVHPKTIGSVYRNRNGALARVIETSEKGVTVKHLRTGRTNHNTWRTFKTFWKREHSVWMPMYPEREQLRQSVPKFLDSCGV